MKSATIKKDKALHPSQDIGLLRKKGIEYIQQLTGKNWTDYNLHDPGVTILEELCYAITDLSYRIEFDIEDILTQDWDAKIDPNANALFTPAAILTSNPVSLNDFRKFLLDGIDVLDNVWIRLLEIPENVAGYSGLHQILAQPDFTLLTGKLAIQLANEISKDAVAPTFNSLLRQPILTALHANRNLCEDYSEIRPLTAKWINVRGDIHISSGYEPEEVLGEILYIIGKYFSSPIQTYSLQELLDMGMTVDEIFKGPKLSNGYILEKDLDEKLGVLSISKINKLIMEIKGVESIKDLRWGNSDSSDRIYIDEGSFPILSHYDKEHEFNLRIYKNNYEITLKGDAVYKYRSELEAAATRSYRLRSASADDLEIPKGKYLEISKYDSIQNHFPRNYHLHKNSLTKSSSNSLKAHSKQLKAYLLFFEQIMANYFEQLHSVSDVFSTGKTQVHQNSYFSQMLDQVPNVNPLLKGLNKDGFSSNGHSTPGMMKFQNLDSAPYGKAFLDTIAESRYEKEDRKNRMLDHLLARFGEKIPDLSISTYDHYYKHVVHSDHPSSAIDIKSKLLRHYEELSRMRGRAADYARDIWLVWEERKEAALKYLADKEAHKEEYKFPDRTKTKLEDYQYSILEVWKEISHYPAIDAEYGQLVQTEGRYDISGLERKVGMFLHIQNDYKRKLVDELKVPLFELPALDEHRNPKNQLQSKAKAIREVVWLEEELKIEMDEPSIEDIVDEDMDQGKFTFEIQEKNGLPNILKYGILMQNYRIGLIKETYGDSNWFTIFKQPGEETWKIIGKHDHRKQANESLQKMIQMLVETSIRSEGFHLIEHVIFRYLIDENLENTATNQRESNDESSAQNSSADHEDDQSILEALDANRFGFVLLDHSKNGFLESEYLSTYSGRELLIKKVLKYGQDRNNYFRKESDRNKYDNRSEYYFELHGPDGPIARSLDLFDLSNSDEADQLIKEQLVKYVKLISEDPGNYFPQMRYFVRTKAREIENHQHEKFKDVNEDFFNFQASMVLPDWPARFQYPNFKQHLENVVKEHTPAHIKMNFIWLNYMEMEEFETLYMDWCAAKRDYIENQILDNPYSNPRVIRNFMDLSDLMIDFLRIAISRLSDKKNLTDD